MLISGIFCPLSLTLFHPHPLLLPGSHIKKVVPLKKSGFVKLHIFSVKYTYVRDATFPPSILLSESQVHNQGLHHILESRWLWLNFFGRGLLVWKTFDDRARSTSRPAGTWPPECGSWDTERLSIMSRSRNYWLTEWGLELTLLGARRQALSLSLCCLRGRSYLKKNWKGIRLPKKIRLGSVTKVWEHFLLEEEKTYSVLIG